MILSFSSWSRRKASISDTRLACRVGVKRRGSRILIVSSVVISREDLLSPGIGGGEELLPAFPGGVTERLDFRELRETFLDGVRYGVSAGVGSDPTGPVDSSSVSHTAMMNYVSIT
jgi:hypothetical protein